MTKYQKLGSETFRLPPIGARDTIQNTFCHSKKDYTQIINQKQNDVLQVTKLDQWSMNKPTKKAKTMINTHNISFLYKSSTIKRKHTRQLGNSYIFMDIQMYLAKIDNELQKIGQINYFSIYKNLEYCSGVYENNFNAVLKSLQKHNQTIQNEVNQIQLKLQMQREEHIKKVHQIQSNQNQQYKLQINQVRQNLQLQENNLKPLKRLLKKIQLSKIKVLLYCLSLGYDVRSQGLIWIIKQLGYVPKHEQFPSFLTQKQIQFIITKYTNLNEVCHAETKMKSQILGKTINQAYEYVNRRKRRQLSLIKQDDEMMKIYADRIKQYSPDRHLYINKATLQIAQSLEKTKPKPTRYEVIYKEASKKLNKICKQRIHKQQYEGKNNKQNKKESILDQKQKKQIIRRKQKRNSTIIIEQFSKMLNLSMRQTKKLEELYTKQQKQFEQILREIRSQKYSQVSKSRGSLSNLQRADSEHKARNPISILGCLVGWKKAEKIIQQQMFSF